MNGYENEEDDKRIAELTRLKDAGLTFSDCVKVFGVERDKDPHASAAFEQKHRDGELEIDDTTVVSDSDDGAYVMAWVWVDKDDKDDSDDGTYTIRGSHGDLVIDATSGTVISRTGYPEIVRFDLDEYRSWYEQREEESLLETAGEEDILDLGYWTNERYVEPVIEHRTGEDGE